MHKLDLPALAEALNGLAETFDRKAISPKALEVWFETLREFPAERVIGLLQSWPKTHSKSPVPAEVWKALNEFGIEERERTARAEKAARERDYERLGVTPHGKRCLALIQGVLKRPKRSPIEHWQKVLATEGLPSISYEYATAPLKKLVREPAPKREPGEDRDEEHAPA